jgi:ankyrin repeat domain-containing protein 50
MQYALAIKPGDADIDEESVYDEEMLTKYCAGLLIVDPVDRKIRLVHKTTQGIKETRFPDGHAMIVERSLAYLSLNVFVSGICPNRQGMYQRLSSYPFAQYAAEGLGYHARQNPKSQNQRMVLDFLKKR